MATEVYRLASREKVLYSLMAAFALVAVPTALVSAAADGRLLMVGFAGAWIIGVLLALWDFAWRRPRLIEASDNGLRFVARRRTIEVPWAQLRVVRVPRFYLSRTELEWKWDQGRLRTSAEFDNLHRLLATVAERAPQADLTHA